MCSKLKQHEQGYKAALFEVTLMFLLLTLNTFVSLIFDLADFLAWLGEERLDSFISRRSHDHWLKC